MVRTENRSLVLRSGKGTKNGVITDIDGKFSMRVPVGTILKITYMGYRSSEVIIRDNKPLTHNG